MKYTYKAYLASGEEETGEVEAVTEADAVRDLGRAGRRVYRLGAAVAHRTRGVRPFAALFDRGDRINLANFFSELAVLCEAGLSVPQALRAMQSNSSSAKRKQVLRAILTSLSSGSSASSAFSNLPAIPPFAIAMIHGGDGTGKIGKIFGSLAAHFQKRDDRRKQIHASLAYPAFLILLSVLAVAIITFVLVPGLQPIFSGTDQKPPFVISFLGAFRDFLTGPGGLQVALAGFCVLLLLTIRDIRVRSSRWMNFVAARTPVLGSALRNEALAFYLATLSMLLETGTTLHRAMAMSAGAVGSQDLRQKLLDAEARVSEGILLPQALDQTGLFDSRVISLIGVGDEASRIDVLAGRAACLLEDEAETTMKRLTAILTPTLTLGIGLMIGMLVVSVMSALLSINELAIR